MGATASTGTTMTARTHAMAGRGVAALRGTAVGLMAFLTVVDLFGTQAVLPSLARAYAVPPATMAVAVNATTFGMALAGLAVALFSHRVDRRWGVAAALALLAIPTALLGLMPSLTLFATLRVVQGVCMATAFTLTLAYLGEACSAEAAAGAFAAYITGNVASNLLGRLLSAGLADHFGLAWNFLGFALLNLAGAALALIVLRPSGAPPAASDRASVVRVWVGHVREPTLRAAFGIGFCVLFAFLGTFTYVNFVLVDAPFMIGPMMLGFVYFVFLPSIFTTPLAGLVVAQVGWRAGLWAALAVAAIGLPALLQPRLEFVLIGLMLVGVGTFLAQAIATGVVGRAARQDRAAASGLYLFAYYLGGLIGTSLLGHAFQRFGWTACVIGVAAALAGAAALALRLRMPAPA
jgi:YNFM family putative membrane transporter